MKYKNKFLGEISIISLKKNNLDDFFLFYSIVTNNEIMSRASIFNHHVGSLEEIKKFFDIISCKEKKFKICFNKILTKNNDLVGIIGLFNAKENKNEPEVLEIGYFLKKEYRNKHITTEISEILLNNIFEKYPNIKIVGDNLIENKISQRILLKLGFKFEKKVINNKGAIINIFKLNKENFLNRKNNNLDIEKELKFIENYPETIDKVDSFIL